MRFEVTVTTPHFEMVECSLAAKVMENLRNKSVKDSYKQPKRADYLQALKEPVVLIGTESSRLWTSSRFDTRASSAEEAVTWLALIDDIHAFQSEFKYLWLLQDAEPEKDGLKGAILLCLTGKTRS